MKKNLSKIGVILLALGTLIFATHKPSTKLRGLATLADYKFWYILRADDGHILKAGVRFYEGSNQTLFTGDAVSGISSKTVYVRTQKITSFPVATKGTTGADSLGSTVKVYTEADFGTISTDDELRTFLNKELDVVVKDAGLTAVSAQEVK